MIKKIKGIGMIGVIASLLLMLSCGPASDESQDYDANEISSPEMDANSSDLKITANTVSLYHFNKTYEAWSCGPYARWTRDVVSGYDLIVGEYHYDEYRGAKLSANTPFASGKSFKFDGIKDYLVGNRCGFYHGLKNLPQGTVEAYVNVTLFSGSACGIVSTYSCVNTDCDTTVSDAFEFGVDTDRKVFVSLPPAGVTLKSNKLLKLGKWYHLATTWDGSYLKIYINGVLDNKVATNAGVGDSNHLDVGRIQNTNAYCKGYIDEVRISRVALYAK